MDFPFISLHVKLNGLKQRKTCSVREMEKHTVPEAAEPLYTGPTGSTALSL